MKLAKNLIIEDDEVALQLREFGHRNFEWHGNHRGIRGKSPSPWERRQWVLTKGTELPPGPLHPIAALAFAMAGFVLKVPGSSVLYTAPDGRWVTAWDGRHGELVIDHGGVVAPVGASIHSHVDPELIDNGHK